MGETSADTQREIELFRDEISAAVEELERRARHAIDLRAQAREHPQILGILGLGTLAGLSMVTYYAVSASREASSPARRVKRATNGVAANVGRGGRRARESLSMGSTKTADTIQSPSKPGLVKSLIWMGLSAGTIALASLIARRISSGIWEAVMREPPPTAKV